MSQRTKNLEVITRRAARLAENVLLNEVVTDPLWREARELLDSITQHEVMYQDDLTALTQYHDGLTKAR